MSPPADPNFASRGPSPKSARGARARAYALSSIVLIASTGAAILGNVLADRYRARPDVTATREQTLAPGTTLLLSRLLKPYRVVIAADSKSLDPKSARAARDVLEEMARAEGDFSFTFIDTASTSGLAAYRQVVGGLVSRDRDLITDQTAAIELANAGAVSLAAYLTDSLSPSLLSMQDKVPGVAPDSQALRKALENAAANARISARDLTDAASRSADALRARLGDIPLPATDRAAETLAHALSPSVDRLADLARDMAQFPNLPAAAGPAADQAANLAPEIEQRRGQAAIVLESMRRLKKPDLLRVTQILESGQAALVIGPPEIGLAAIDLDALFPPGSVLSTGSTSSIDHRRRAEELVSSALSALLTPRRPIVVLLHAEITPLLDQPGLFTHLQQRLRLRGIDAVEWPVVLNPERPSLLAADPEANNPEKRRPVVYAAIAPDSSAASARAGTPGGAQRAALVGDNVRTLAEEGANVLICMNPSVLPGQGDTDPITAVLPRFGLIADTGRPLLKEHFTPRGRAVETVQLLQGAGGGQTPINGAIRGLPAAFSWPIALVERTAPEKIRLTITPLYRVPAAESLWGESEWLRLWQTPSEARALLRQEELPRFNEGRDARWPEGNPTKPDQHWMLAAAVQRAELDKPPQRAVIVGSNSWFIDQVTQAATMVDGRAAPRNPGNLELFEASIYWLANQDQLIAQSPAAMASPVISPISEVALSRLRIVVILGLPLGVLLLGGLYRIIRG